MITAPLGEPLVLDASLPPFTDATAEERAAIGDWLDAIGVGHKLTYRVEVHPTHLIVFQYHGPKPHVEFNCPEWRLPSFDVCRVPPQVRFG